MATIGYARVSTADQNMALQLDALREAGIDRVFRDQGVSGSTSARPRLDRVSTVSGHVIPQV
jgi:DNA invertase Pin-like site-specific DNA recombinase